MSENEQNVLIQERKQNDKKIARKIWLAVFLLLPSLVALISFVIIYNNLHFSPSNIYDITLYDEEGKIIASEQNYLRDAENEGLISLFSSVTENPSNPVEIPEHVLNAHKFYAVVNYLNTVNEYEFYFLPSTLEGYFRYNGNVYKMLDNVVEKFLLSRFAEDMYDNSEPPTMYSRVGDVIVPCEVNWNYKTVDGKYRTASSYTSTDDIFDYDMASALGFSFSIKPDLCNMDVYKGDLLIFSGSDRDASSLTFQKGEIVRVEVEAQWFYGSSKDFYGTVKYNFDVNITDRAEFYTNGNTFAIGSVLGISCSNINDLSKIEFTSEPSLPILPRFEVSGGNVVALLPILKETPLGEYNITLKYGAAVQTFVVNVTEAEKGDSIECSADAQKVRAALSESTLQEISRLTKFASDNSKGEKLFYGDFLDYSDEEIGALQYSSFGDIYVNGDEEYISDGHEYRFEKSGGVSVPALNGGKVIKTGYNDYLGNYVIISHGCGLSTWYAHLSTVDVNVGDFVVIEQTVGKTGESGLSSVENVMIFATLESEFINPAYLCGNHFD